MPEFATSVVAMKLPTIRSQAIISCSWSLPSAVADPPGLLGHQYSAILLVKYLRGYLPPNELPSR